MRTLGLIASGAAGALLALELLLRVLPTSSASATGYYFDDVILTYPAHHRFRTATGWNFENARAHRSNNFGFLADHDFRRNPGAVALIGDSFVEASMLAPRDRLAAQLEGRLDSREVYAMGSPGSALLDYAERMRFASERFGIRDFVLLLEHGDVAQSLCGSGNVHAPCLDRVTLRPRIEKQPPAGRLKRLLRDFALPQYLFSQLKLDPAGWLARLRAHGDAALPAPPPRDPSLLPLQTARHIINEFFARTQPYRRGRVILILTGSAPSDPLRNLISEAARANGAVLIESEPLLAESAASSGLSMTVSPRDHHLNRVALGILAAKVTPLLGAGQVTAP